MENKYGRIEKAAFLKRFMIPVTTALLGWLVLHLVSEHLGWIESRVMYKFAMNVVHVVLCSYLAFNGFFVYRAMCMRGAGLAERIAGSYITPMAYAIKEIIRVSEFFTVGESFYYCLCAYPVLGMFVGQAGLLALSEILCRVYYKKRNLYNGNAVTVLPVAVFIASMTALYFLFFYDAGAMVFFAYSELYKLIFK
ncbi:MAG: hypothetical protein MUC76_08455 [Spirochaetes bacterium]|jgi:hypothetical protein|nr:hypothetical protein [Spirochaetota bacterium]